MRKPSGSPMVFTKNDVEITAREKLYHGFFLLDLYRFYHRLFGGGMSGEVTREIFERGYVAISLPSDPERDEAVLVEQIRITAFDTSESSWLPEMMAKMIKEGETAEDVAYREAMEEAGLEVKRMKPVLSYLTSPSDTSERLSTLIGEVGAMIVSGIYGLADENEDTHVCVASRERAYQWVEEGRIDNAASVIALQWLQLHYQELEAERRK